MAALHSERAGALGVTLLPFRRTESRNDADLPEYTKLLGKIYDMHDGVSATLVRANALIPKQALSASYALVVVDPVLKTVALAGAAAQICGFTFPDMKDVPAGNLFWALIPTPGESRLTVVADAGGISAAGVLAIAGIVGTMDENADVATPGATVLQGIVAIAAGEAGDMAVIRNTVL